MKQYDIMCPVYGSMNKMLYINETDDRKVCEGFRE